jgi:chemotaxis protein methyltransferase CheR
MNASREQSATDIELRLLLEAIYLRFHHDFRSYSMASLRRRVAAALPELGCATISALQEKLLHEPDSFSRLLGFLTVQVSELFRDPSFFRAFRERVVPELRTYPSIKIWVPGCSAGEEVYSLAIILREEGLFDRAILYGTDINTEALAQAESGVYPLERLAEFSKNYLLAGGKSSLSGYYTAGYGRAIFDRSMRAQLVFSDHSLATDGVFAEVQAITCRNVLIYFDDALQERALDLFQRSLCRRGFLGLGSRETLRFSRYAPLFEEVEREERIYRRLPG